MIFSSAREVLLCVGRDTVSSVVALIAALVLAGPPRATLSTAAGTVPLVHVVVVLERALRCPVLDGEEDGDGRAGSDWCRSGSAFVAEARAGRDRGRSRSPSSTRGRVVSWAAARGGGVTVHATGPRGWVTYVGRLKVS